MLRVSAMFAVLGLLFLVVITSTDAQTLYPVAGQDFSGTDNECTFPCRVETIDGSPLTLTPHLIWAKKRDQDLADTIEDLPDEPFVDLRDPYWYEVELTGFSKDYECRLVELQDKVYYNCDYVEKNCHYVVHSGEYKCILTNLHEDRIYSHVIHNDFQHNMPYGAPCFAATLIASSLTASYNESLGIVVRWDTDVASRPSNQSICNDGLQFDVLVRSYASYEDYIVENVEPEHIFDFATTIRPNGTEFLFPTERVRLNRYYVFVVRNEWRNTAGFYIDQVEVESPLYYFGRQKKPSLSFPEQSTTVIRASLHSTVELRCEGSGVPAPSVNLIHGSLHITSEVPDKTVASKSLVVTTNTVGYYHCVASSTYVAPEGGAEPAFSYKTIVIQLEEAPPVDTELICAPNGNTHCISVFGDAHVLVNTTNFEFQKRVDDLVVDLDQYLMNNTTAYNTTFLRKVAKCVDHAKALMCSSAFPYCSPDTLLTRPICKNSCQEFAPGGACEGVFDLEQFPGLREIMTSNCDARVHPAGESPECVHLSLEIPPISERSWCVVDDGTSYAGDVFVTSNGTICQDWVSQSPHEHFTSRPELLHQASRDCRNPGGSGERPWCYTIDSSIRWEYCDPPQCTVCEEYKGFTCSHLPGYEGGLVYVNRHESQWDRDGVGLADPWMSDVLLKLLRQSEVPQGCEMGIRELLCHKTLPLCQANSSSPSSLCSEHCKLARLLQVCPQNLLRRLEGEMAKTGITFAEPACESSEGEECLPLEMSLVTSVSDGMSTVTVGSEGEIANCYNASDNGHGYQGNISTTSDGTPCQAWGSDSPDLAENYCRNPAQVGMRPWCFTDVEGGVWGYCDISECSAIGLFEAATVVSTTRVSLISICSLLISICIITIITTTIIVMKKRRKKTFSPIHDEVGNISPYYVTTSHPYYSEVKFSEDSHYYSKIDNDHHYDTIHYSNEQYDDILSAVEEHTEINTRKGHLFPTCKDASYDRSQMYKLIARCEQAPAPSMADILKKVAIRNVQRNHFSKVKLFDMSGQVESVYEHVATYEQVPDPAPIWRHITGTSHDGHYEVAQTYEHLTGYECVRYDKMIEEMFSYLQSGDMKIGDRSSHSLRRPTNTATQSTNPQTQGDKRAGDGDEEPYEEFQYKEGTVEMLKMLASSTVSSEYECVQPHEVVANYERVHYSDEVKSALVRQFAITSDNIVVV